MTYGVKQRWEGSHLSSLQARLPQSFIYNVNILTNPPQNMLYKKLILILHLMY